MKKKGDVMYGVYNFNRPPVHVTNRRRDAIRWAEEWTGEPWSKIQDYVQVKKVCVVEFSDD